MSRLALVGGRTEPADSRAFCTRAIAQQALGELVAERAMHEIAAGAAVDIAWQRFVELGFRNGRQGTAARAYMLRIAKAAAEASA